MAVQSSAGASLAISAAIPASFNATGYAALTYTTVGEVTNIGEFGKEFELIEHAPLASRGVKKFKGGYNNGTIEPEIALDPDDAGQILMETASNSDAKYSFKITLQDGTIYYLMGLVMSFRPNVGTVNDLIMAAASIEVDSPEIVRV